eukprot:scaffold115029_cov31-Tisochrysis_lutea.AAC.8
MQGAAHSPSADPSRCKRQCHPGRSRAHATIWGGESMSFPRFSWTFALLTVSRSRCPQPKLEAIMSLLIGSSAGMNEDCDDLESFSSRIASHQASSHHSCTSSPGWVALRKSTGVAGGRGRKRLQGTHSCSRVVAPSVSANAS